VTTAWRKACDLPVRSFLRAHVKHIIILINGSPQILLLSMDLNEDLINEKCVTISLMFSPKSKGVLRPEFVSPQTNSLIAHLEATLRHQVFDITMPEVEVIKAKRRL